MNRFNLNYLHVYLDQKKNWVGANWPFLEDGGIARGDETIIPNIS